jgi:hypothetical protein
MSGALLDWALEALSGYVAADALSEGPSGVLAAVDHRQDKRMLSEVLDHDPRHEDSDAFLGRVQRALAERTLVLKGITTDGAALSPAPIRTVCGEGPHQLCPLHGIKELTQGVLKAVAQARERLATSKPALQRGRPSCTDKDARRLARKSKSIPQHISALFQERFLFVTRRLTPSERRRLLSSTRGWPPLRTLREIMEHLDAWFDRRCHTQTALGTLKQRRQWVNRFTWIGDAFKKVFAPTLEKALTFLDDTLLPATSKAVERGNRRHRKRQKRVYRVRSKGC